ncbi:hypothetical protein P8631_12255, partial [Guyparkeria sp. 1SP6A2]|nr:hypothetical protein [Guyparkeria sp. 1SP6A2]
MNKISATLRIGLGGGGILSMIAGLFSDFFIPIGPYGFYIGSALAGLLLVSLLIRVLPFTNNVASRALGISWYLPVFFLLVASSGLTFTSYYFSKNGTDGSGYLAQHFPEAREAQKQLLGEISENTEAISRSTNKTAQNTQVIKEVVKRETSEDPRKELANMNISWTYESFMDEVYRGDEKTIKLF